MKRFFSEERMILTMALVVGILLGIVALGHGAEPDAKTKVKIGFALSGPKKSAKTHSKPCECFEGGDCECGENCQCATPKDEYTAAYRALRSRAIRNSQPLLIWVNTPNVMKLADGFRDCYHYECRSFQGKGDQRVILGVPDGKGDIDAACCFDGDPCVQCIRGYLDAPKANVQVRQTAPNYQCQVSGCSSCSGGGCPTCTSGNCASCNMGACPSCAGGVQGVPFMGCQSGCCGGGCSSGACQSCGSGGCVGCQGCSGSRRHRR